MIFAFYVDEFTIVHTNMARKRHHFTRKRTSSFFLCLYKPRPHYYPLTIAPRPSDPDMGVCLPPSSVTRALNNYKYEDDHANCIFFYIIDKYL